MNKFSIVSFLLLFLHGCAAIPEDVRERRAREISAMRIATANGPVQVKRTSLCAQSESGAVYCGT